MKHCLYLCRRANKNGTAMQRMNVVVIESCYHYQYSNRLGKCATFFDSVAELGAAKLMLQKKNINSAG